MPNNDEDILLSPDTASDGADDSKFTDEQQNVLEALSSISADMPDFDEPMLSDSDMQRLANMGLDNIIDDVTADSISVEDLFGIDSNTETFNFEKIDSAMSNIDNSDKKAVNDESSKKSESDNKQKSAADKITTAEDVDNNINVFAGEASEANSDNKEKDKKKHSKKQKKSKAYAQTGELLEEQSTNKRNKKSKKGFFGVLKKVFFESIEEVEPMMSEEEVKKANQDSKKADDNKELIKDIASKDAESLDENEKLINELYGDEAKTEEQSAPRKGLFAKMKYRFEQMKKKTQEEDIAEQEAEEREYEKNKAAKEKKKLAKKEKAETAAIEKKEKAEEAKKLKDQKKEQKKAQKAEKPKKEKKPKPAPKPEDILKIKPKSVVLFLVFVAGVVTLISVSNSIISYDNALAAAKTGIENGDYAKAYEVLSGMELRENDKGMYDQAAMVMYVQVHYESYENYMKLGMKTEAINSLIKGLDRYNEYYYSAQELGAAKYLDYVKTDILNAFNEKFKISEKQAEELLELSYNNFTEYYTKIEAYGKVKQ